MKIWGCLCGLLLWAGLGWAQEYNRSSFSLILMDYKDELRPSVQSKFYSVKMGDRFDKNEIPTRIIFYEGSRMHKVKNSAGEDVIAVPDHTSQLTTYLNQQNVGLQVIGYLFNRQPDGIMDAERINQRAAYNKTDADYKVAQASAKRMSALQEGGEKLIRNSYLMVFEFANLRCEYVPNKKYPSDEDYYWKATPIVYLYRLDWNDGLKNQFYEECWSDEYMTEEERTQANARYEQFQVPLKLVMTRHIDAQEKTGIVAWRKQTKEERKGTTEEELKQKALDELLRSAFSALRTEVEDSQAEFQVKSAVYDTKPIRAKIGRKEGVRTNHRYFLYEYYSEDGGKTLQKKRKGVVRATNKISDNRSITTGNTRPTEFYQIAGGRVQPGMELVEKKALGLSVDGGYQFGDLNGIYLGVNGCVYGRKNLNHYFRIDAVYGLDNYEIEWVNDANVVKKDITYNLMTFGVAYGYGLVKSNWELYPYLGTGGNSLLSTTNSDTTEKLENTDEEKEKDSSFDDESAWMVNAGIRCNINIRYPVQIFGEANYSLIVSEGKVYKAVRKVHDDLDKASNGLNFRVGLRICF